MDFFAHQDQARRRSGLLLVYFGLAVVLIVLAVHATVWGLLGVGASKSSQAPMALPFWDPNLLAWTVLGTFGVILVGSLVKMAELRSGGEAVARMLGGVPIPPDTVDLRQRRLLNVVEEMAIAAGTPVPPVYLLEAESGINAFAAGHSPSDAVIGVTRGSLETLSRDELQGVIAHEFSHILHGDMRLNLRLIGWLHGILVLTLLGHILLRAATQVRTRSSNRGKGGEGAVRLGVLVLGLALIVIGSAGVFFARLIQSAVCRQREFLADASAVQYTRNPSGIAGALKKIGGLSRGSRLDEPKAAAASHLFFGNALGSAWAGLMATHPPLVVRIRRLDPSFDGQMAAAAAAAAADDVVDRTAPVAGLAAGAGRTAETRATAPSAMGMVDQVGAPTPAHLEFAERLRRGLPSEIAEALQRPGDAQALILGLLMDPAEAVRRRQQAALARSALAGLSPRIEALRAPVASLPAGHRIAVLDLALPVLRGLSAAAVQALRETARRLAEADEEINLFEYALQAVLDQRLRGWLEPASSAAVRHISLTGVRAECRLLLSTLAHLGGDATAAEAAFAAGAAVLGTAAAAGLLPADQCTLAAVDQALARLAELAFPLRRRVLMACLDTVLHDRRVLVDEAELLRAIAAVLGCPMPPVLATTERAAA